MLTRNKSIIMEAKSNRERDVMYNRTMIEKSTLVRGRMPPVDLAEYIMKL